MGLVTVLMAIAHLGFWVLLLGIGVHKALMKRGRDSEQGITAAGEDYS